MPEATTEHLVSYSWPGNIRALRNVIERAVVLPRARPVLKLGHDLAPTAPAVGNRRTDGSDHPALGAPVADTNTGPSVRASIPPRLSTLQDVEREHIVAVLRERRGIVEGPNGAAPILNLRPNTLRSRMKRLRIKRLGHEIS